jgi:perosamine synthetase
MIPLKGSKNNPTYPMELSAHAWKDNWKTLLPEDTESICRQMGTQPLSIASGGILKRFEKIYAAFAGTTYAVATNNGTAALYAALWAAGIRAGDEVLVCDYGFIAMAGAIVTLGAIMVPVDMEAGTFTMDPVDLSRKITEKSKAVLVHNPWGVPARLDAIRAVTGLPVILDASHAHGATYQDKPLASWADITCFSLGMGKLITGGELGCAVTDNAEYRDRMILLGHTHRSPADLVTKIWDGNTVGLKFRPHVIALQIALCQMKRFAQKKALLINTCRRIEDIFAGSGFTPQAVPPGGSRVYWRLVFRLDDSLWGDLPPADVESLLRKVNLPIESNPYLPLLQHQSPFLWAENTSLVRHEACPVAAAVTPRLVTFPAPVDIDEGVFSQISASLDNAQKSAAKAAN